MLTNSCFATHDSADSYLSFLSSSSSYVVSVVSWWSTFLPKQRGLVAAHQDVLLASPIFPNHAVSGVSSFKSAIICSRILNFWILPVTVWGKDATNETYRGTL